MTPGPFHATSSDLNESDAPEECEVLLALFAGPTGPVQLGRCLAGENDGRIVLLRRVMAAEVSDLTDAIHRAQLIASSQLVKVLGLLRKGRARYIASEYLEGVSLWELQDARYQGQIPPDVATRVILDALVSASTAAMRLENVGVEGLQRHIFADTVWITGFGGTLLTEAGVAQHISMAPRYESGEVRKGSFGGAPETDVQAAALELRRLLSGHSTGHPEIPPALAQIIERGLSESPRDAFASPTAMAEALKELPPPLLASEERVGKITRGLVEPTLETRRRRLAKLLASGDRNTLDEPTASYRSPAPRSRDAREPAKEDTTRGDAAEPASSESPTTNAPDDDNEETRVYRVDIEPGTDSVSTQRPTRYLQLDEDSATFTEPGSSGPPRSSERTWRAIAISALLGIVVLVVGRVVGLW